jgi:hypothetical protein
MTVDIHLTRLFGDRLDENVERQIILDESVRNEVLHVIKRKLENGAFTISEYEFDLED